MASTPPPTPSRTDRLVVWLPDVAELLAAVGVAIALFHLLPFYVALLICCVALVGAIEFSAWKVRRDRTTAPVADPDRS